MRSNHKNTGIRAGLLTPCPKLPNCICSQHTGAPLGDREPWNYKNTRSEMLKALLSVIAAKGGAKMVTQNHEYIHAEFKTALFGFVDDVEFYLPENEKLIHYRSASRVGTWDLFQNDLRMKRLKKRLRKKGLELT